MMTSEERYVTRDELAARMAELELHIVDRIAALERRMDDHFRTQMRWMLGLMFGLYTMLVGMILAVVIFGLNILSRLPTPPAS